MLCQSPIFAALVIFSSILSAMAADDATTSNIPREVLDTLDYEYSNRAFALASATRLADATREPREQAFWRAFLALEQHNRQRYAPQAAQFGIDPQGSFYDGVRSWFVSLAVSVAPERTLNKLLINTRVYVPRLQRLQQIGPPEHMDFFDYVVAQEKVQLETLEYILDDEWEAATQRLQEFVAEQKQ